MWTPDKNIVANGFSTPTTWRSNRFTPVRIPATERKWRSPQAPADADVFHIVHKVPAGDSPYVRAKHVQLVDKDPVRAIPMFWTAINSGDRVDSALKDMAVVMKQLNRSDEAIEAVKSFRHLCPLESQESLDNILLELYKRSGRTREQIELLQVKLKHIEQGTAFGGKRSKMARSQGKKVQITVEQDYSRLLGNLAWAYLQQDNYKSAEEFYRKALSLEPDKNKQCNLAICLMYTQRMTEAKFLLRTVRSAIENQQIDDSYSKSYERAVQVMDVLESEKSEGKNNQTPFSVLLQGISGEGYKKDTSLQSSPQPVFDNNMNRGCHTGGPYEKRVDFVYKMTGGNVLEVPYTEPRRSLLSFQKEDQRRGCWERENAVGSCNKRLLFGEFPTGNVSQVERTEKCQDFSKIKSKKSWGGVVEEDEHKLFNDIIDFSDENTDYNIIQETPVQNDESENLGQKMASLIMKDGYHSQPGKSGVKRSLCFDTNKQNAKAENVCSSPLQKKTLEFGSHESDLTMDKEYVSGSCVKSVPKQNAKAENVCSSPLQKKTLEFGSHESDLTNKQNAKAENVCSSPLQKKTLEFGSHESDLTMDKEYVSGSCVKSVQRTRLQVFRDITLYSESPRP